MLQDCEFFTIDTVIDRWNQPVSVYVDMNENLSYEDIGRELAKNGVFFAGCKAAAPASILFENAPEDCVVIGTEDDGVICFRSDDMIHMTWIPEFISVLAKVSDFINE